MTASVHSKLDAIGQHGSDYLQPVWLGEALLVCLIVNLDLRTGW